MFLYRLPVDEGIFYVKPLLLLDVDGVLNALLHRTPENTWKLWNEAVCNGYRIQYAPAMGKRLADLDVDIVWLTTWQGSANKWIAPLFGWDELPVVPDEPPMMELAQFDRIWWKAIQAEQFLADSPTRPIIWIDDDLRYWHTAQRAWLENREGPSLLISPTAAMGIHPNELDRVAQFVLECSDGAGLVLGR